jgi:hypothetical protein
MGVLLIWTIPVLIHIIETSGWVQENAGRRMAKLGIHGK